MKEENINNFSNNDDNQLKLIELYIKEWDIVIRTQMHFNDLILRFRSITLTAFITLFGAIFALQEYSEPVVEINRLIFLILVVLWCTAFFLDFCYYHRLLLGAVAHAKKFDNMELAKKLEFFGLTECIKEHVQPPTSKILVIIYYGFPLLASIIIYCIAQI